MPKPTIPNSTFPKYIPYPSLSVANNIIANNAKNVIETI